MLIHKSSVLSRIWQKNKGLIISLHPVNVTPVTPVNEFVNYNLQKDVAFAIMHMSFDNTCSIKEHSFGVTSAIH